MALISDCKVFPKVGDVKTGYNAEHQNTKKYEFSIKAKKRLRNLHWDLFHLTFPVCNICVCSRARHPEAQSLGAFRA